MNEQEQRLKQALDGFLVAFRNLDLTPFIEAFETEATVFFPLADVPQRISGIQEIAAIFTTVFASLRSRRPAGPPYLQLEPVDVQITITGTLALVSFHLHELVEEQAILCRRTFVWVDGGTRWRILHLHASNQPANAMVRSK